MKGAATAVIALGMGAPLEAQDRPSVAPKNMQAIAPGFAQYTDKVLFGDVWLRSELSPRDRSLVTVSVLIATGKSAQLNRHLDRGLSNGIKPTEVAGMVTHLAFYSGWPNAVSALNVIEQVFAERKIDTRLMWPPAGAAANPPVPGAARAPAVDEQIAAVSPKLAELTAHVLFDDLWQRSDLTPRDRSLVTIAALSANGDFDQLASHLRRGLENGLTRAQIGEALTHLAFYAGWPKATGAVAIAKAVFDETGAGPAAQPKLRLVPPGQAPAAAPASNFTGSAVVTSPFQGTGGARLRGATVTFRPGAHTNWHTHPLGQLLIVTRGRGWVQAEGEPVRAIKAGDVVWTAPGTKHWHGATRASGLTHVAVSESADGVSVAWLQPVTDEQYRGPE